ncbi:MAG: M48 family metallopeptidase [Treponemataceae bacterium]|nr:M48 family metallopeptidase [Treponemataceae bacterium]
MKRFAVFFAFLLMVPFFCCAFSKVESTGKNALILMSLEEEQQLGAESYNEILKESTISKNATYNKRLETVAKRLIEAVGTDAPEGTEWEYNVIEDDQVNAFAVPGGKIAVYSGLMAIASDDELAYVVGHELGHVTARHGAQRMSQETVISLVGSLVQGSLKSDRSQAIFSIAYGLGSEYGLVLPYSRKNEYEADDLGSLYAARAGYNPDGGLSMLKKLKELGGSSSVPEWLSTHPLDDNRIQKLQQLYERNVAEYKKAAEAQKAQEAKNTKNNKNSKGKRR